MLNYLILYLKTDVLLLTDVYQTFRKVSANFFKIDPLHYIAVSGYSCTA